MLRTIIKGCYPCCYKCRHRNLNVYPNVYSCEGSFLFRGNSNDPNSSYNNEQMEQGILMKLTKNPDKNSLWTRN